MDAPSITLSHRFLDIAFGVGTSLIAIVAGLVMWIILFDHDGIEPGGGTLDCARRMWPFLLLLVAGGPVAWWYHRTVPRRLVVFAFGVLGTITIIAFRWFVLG
jgi:hypothetical protein